MAQFEIKLTELDNGGKDYDLPLPTAWLDANLGVEGVKADPETQGRLKFYASLSGSDIIIHGRIKARVIAECARCLSDAPIAVDTDLTGLFSKRSAATVEELELTPEDLNRVVYVGDSIILDEFVRDQVLLEVPMQSLCREDCPGIPVPDHIRGPEVLEDGPVLDGKRIDPRFAPLLALKDLANGSSSKPDAAKAKKK